MQKDGFQIKENKSQGYIKVYRSFMGWEWCDDVNTKGVSMISRLTESCFLSVMVGDDYYGVIRHENGKCLHAF